MVELEYSGHRRMSLLWALPHDIQCACYIEIEIYIRY